MGVKIAKLLTMYSSLTLDLLLIILHIVIIVKQMIINIYITYIINYYQLVNFNLIFIFISKQSYFYAYLLNYNYNY